MADIVQRIAAGHNASGSTKPLDQLDPPKFDRVFVGFRNKFHPRPARRNGRGIDVGFGDAWDEWIVPIASPEEAKLLADIGPECTIYTYNHSTGEWHYYNAIKNNPEWDPSDWDQGDWHELTYTFRRLELLS